MYAKNSFPVGPNLQQQNETGLLPKNMTFEKMAFIILGKLNFTKIMKSTCFITIFVIVSRSILVVLILLLYDYYFIIITGAMLMKVHALPVYASKTMFLPY